MEHTHALCSCEENTNTCMIMRTQMHTLAWSTTHASMHFAVSHKAKQNVPHLIRPNALEGAHFFSGVQTRACSVEALCTQTHVPARLQHTQCSVARQKITCWLPHMQKHTHQPGLPLPSPTHPHTHTRWCGTTNDNMCTALCASTHAPARSRATTGMHSRVRAM